MASSTGSPEPALRRFELASLTHLGYGVDFQHCAGSGEPVAPNQPLQTLQVIVKQRGVTGFMREYARQQFVNIESAIQH